MKKLYGKDSFKIILPDGICIPNIDDEKLIKLYKLLKPIVNIKEMKYLLKEYELSELRDQSFLWNRDDDKTIFINNDMLENVGDFICLHSYGYDYLFKPSIAEVLSQIPSNLIEKSDLFEIIERPCSEEDVYKYKDVFDQDYYLSKVRTYKLNRKNNN